MGAPARIGSIEALWLDRRPYMLNRSVFDDLAFIEGLARAAAEETFVEFAKIFRGSGPQDRKLSF